MMDEHIDAVMTLYNYRETVEKEAYLDSFEDIEENDFNLNIPRYVENFEQEEEIDRNDLLKSMTETDQELEQTQSGFLGLLKELTSTAVAIMTSLNDQIGKIGG